jgi:hypothetical protein
MLVIVEDFKQLIMSILSRACVRFYPTENYYNGCGVKAKYRFEYNERFRRLIEARLPFRHDIEASSASSNSDSDPLWNKMCQIIIKIMIILKHTIK